MSRTYRRRVRDAVFAAREPSRKRGLVGGFEGGGATSRQSATFYIAYAGLTTLQWLKPALRVPAKRSSAPPASGASPRQKLVLFTEHRDTLHYLQDRITTLLGYADSVVVIHGILAREIRHKAQEAFLHDSAVQLRRFFGYLTPR